MTLPFFVGTLTITPKALPEGKEFASEEAQRTYEEYVNILLTRRPGSIALVILKNTQGGLAKKPTHF